MMKEEAKSQVSALVEKYRSLSEGEARGTNEEATKQGYILPLFRALGWEPDNVDEVAPEETVSNGRVDYAFKINGISRFYLEAKPVRADLTNPEYAKQAITYAYHQGVTWAILTNFQEMRVFNAQRETNALGQARFLTLRYDQYVSDFEKLWLLSKESIAAGGLEKEAAKYGALPPRIPIEKRLYSQLRNWRERLSNEINQYDDKVPFAQIDEIIQTLFNRLIFIRTTEDRRLEDPVLMPLLRQEGRRESLLARLRRVFRQFDGYYDSDLFRHHPADQTFFQDDTLTDIVQGLYDIPGGLASYDFSLIDADILGAVYEQYLGYVTQIAKRRAEEAQRRMDLGLPQDTVLELTANRERRKEQGIYYTPKWVVDYIVKQTVGRFIQEHQKHPDDIHNIKMLDMACGSGSFLIRAYDELLKWHAESSGREVRQIPSEERTLILRNNIFGVDLDRQAVEIARLNLLLRALARRELLPTLDRNVLRGNSLISGGEAELKPFFGENWQEKHPFNWEQEFREVMSQGGFDVIIGNPPYVRIQTLPRDEAEYHRNNYESAFGSFDIYVMFIEKGLKLLTPGGRLGFITSGKFLKTVYGERLRNLLHREATVEKIVDLSGQKVFSEATTYPAIVVLKKGCEDVGLEYVYASEGKEIGLAADFAGLPKTSVPQAAIEQGIWPPPSGKTRELIQKLQKQSVTLRELSERMFQGLITSADKIYTLAKRGEGREGYIRVYSRALAKEYILERVLLKPLLSGEHVDRYIALATNQLLLFPYKVRGGEATLIPSDEFALQYPLCWQYLLDNRRALEDREDGKMRHERWYAFGRTQSLGLHDFKKFAIPRLVHRLQAYFDDKGTFYLDNVDVGGLILKDASQNAYLNILGLLNSKLLDWYFRQISVPFRGGFRSANRQFLEPLPIHRNFMDKESHDRVVALVERMLELHKRLSPVRGIGFNGRGAKAGNRTHRQRDRLPSL